VWLRAVHDDQDTERIGCEAERVWVVQDQDEMCADSYDSTNCVFLDGVSGLRAKYSVFLVVIFFVEEKDFAQIGLDG